jgi:ligand-binding sensor protein
VVFITNINTHLIIRNINNQDEISSPVLIQKQIQKQTKKLTQEQTQTPTQYLIDKHLDEISSEENFKKKYCYSVKKLVKSKIEKQHLVKQNLDNNIYVKKFSKDNSDRDWNWKNKDFKYSPTRAKLMPDYIGSYCMDALSMALHIVYYSTSTKEAIFKAVNMNGDADTVACIVGQIAGSIWGLDKDLLDLYEIVSKFDKSKFAIMAHLLYNKITKSRFK